jgi:hypothetical protein
MGASLSTKALRVLAGLAVLALIQFPGAQGAWGATTQTFFSPGDHSFTVPLGVTSITVTAIGAGGGNCTPAHGGRGAAITATVPVTPGEALVAAVGGPGGPCNGNYVGGVGGGGGGGAGTRGGTGAGGGGASVVAPGTFIPELAQALVVAGGGGGSTSFLESDNGGDAGSPGTDGTVAGSGGGAGTQSSGGAGGVAGTNAQAGSAGSFGTGGAGGDGDLAPDGTAAGGGGGGGGYFGGGGGGGSAQLQEAGGGGGGSSFVVAGATNASGTLTSSGAEIMITPNFTVAPTATISAPRSGGTYTLGQVVQTTFSCADAPGAPGIASCVDSNGTTRTMSGGRGHLVTSSVGTFTYTVTATSHDGLIGRASITYSVAPAAMIVHAIVSNTLHTAKFAFKAIGHATGFQCALVKQKPHRQSTPSFSSCLSPKLYKHLKPGKYTFDVRSVSAGIRGMPAGKRFTIT